MYESYTCCWFDIKFKSSANSHTAQRAPFNSHGCLWSAELCTNMFFRVVLIGKENYDMFATFYDTAKHILAVATNTEFILQYKHWHCIFMLRKSKCLEIRSVFHQRSSTLLYQEGQSAQFQSKEKEIHLSFFSWEMGWIIKKMHFRIAKLRRCKSRDKL